MDELARNPHLDTPETPVIKIKESIQIKFVFVNRLKFVFVNRRETDWKFAARHFEHSSGCNFDKFLGGIPCLERLAGHIYFTKYLSIGNEQGSFHVTYERLKFIGPYQVSFEDMKELLVVLRLIVSSLNLEELHISSSSITTTTDIYDVEFWEKDWPADCTFGKLKIAQMAEFSGLPHGIAFIKFLLGHSPLLEQMIVAPTIYVTDKVVKMLIDLFVSFSPGFSSSYSQIHSRACFRLIKEIAGFSRLFNL